jgi:hypothetical protein
VPTPPFCSQVPRPEQLFGQHFCEQSPPQKPSRHWHVPLKHRPAPEQSAAHVPANGGSGLGEAGAGARGHRGACRRTDRAIKVGPARLALAHAVVARSPTHAVVHAGHRRQRGIRCCAANGAYSKRWGGHVVRGLRAEEGASGELCEQWRWSHARMCLRVWPGPCSVQARERCEPGSKELQRRAPASLATSQVASASRLPPEDGMLCSSLSLDGRPKKGAARREE